MFKNKLVLLLALLMVIAVTCLIGIAWWKKNISAVNDSSEKVSFVIPRGRSAMQIANMLHDEGLIRSPLAFKIYVQVSGKSGNINAGEFRLDENMTLPEIVEALGRGPLELWVTVPEGLRKEEIASKFIEGLEMKGERKTEFGDEFLEFSEDKEGYLFPDTYLFPRDVDAITVVNKMVQTLDSKINGAMLEKIDNGSYDLGDYITMASIIEREAVTDQERPIVAGILWKRLETDGWLIQADATIQYEIGTVNCKNQRLSCDDWWPILTRDDIGVLSPYNSYMVDSLPPTPISNPGIKSIEAAIFPEKSNYWFYIHDPEGNIHYSETIEGHNENIRNYLGK